MRRYTAGNGSDSSAAAWAYKAANAGLRLPTLYVIDTAPCYAGHPLSQRFLLTDWPSPLVWSYYGTFATAVIKRGQVESKIGLESQTLDVTWTPRDSDIVLASPLLTVLDGFRDGIFDNGEVEVWEAILLPGGDCNTLGACCLFGGRIGNIEPNRAGVKIAVTSRMEAFSTQVPTVLIEPSNITAQYLPGQLPAGAPSSLTVAAGSTTSLILATASGSTPASGVYDGGYLVFTSGYLGGQSANIVAAGPSGTSGVWAFALDQPLPFAPAAGDAFTGYIGAAAEPAFPYVPSEIDSAMLTG